VQIGSASWILSNLPEDLKNEIAATLKESLEGGEVVSLLTSGASVALFRFRDTPRPGARATLQALKEKLGMRLVMLTGDHAASARSIAAQLGIDHYLFDLKPEDKLRYISQEENLAMIGDGINDAPALARATVGISMGKVGSTTAVDASDIVLLQDNFQILEWLVKKSRQVVGIVKENLVIALGAILFATIAALLGLIPLWLAVLFHEGGTLIVGLNALRLLR
jgi:Zn2+/Cd2+-exporting ATPase